MINSKMQKKEMRKHSRHCMREKYFENYEGSLPAATLLWQFCADGVSVPFDKNDSSCQKTVWDKRML